MSGPTPKENKRIFHSVCSNCTNEIVVKLGKGHYHDSKKERYVRCSECRTINRASEVEK